MNRTTNWMPLVRHKRSQNAGVAYALVDAGTAVVGALTKTSARTRGECGPAADGVYSRAIVGPLGQAPAP
jgi:hypothetical protein